MLKGKAVLYVKGAPEILLSLCNLPTEVRTRYEAQLHQYQSRAMRTLALAYRIVESPTEQEKPLDELIQEGLQLQGIFGIMDPVRSEVPAAIQQCRKAGIGVKIITGDTSGTAKEIARQIGLWGESSTDDEIITGADFEALTDDEAKADLPVLRLWHAHVLWTRSASYAFSKSWAKL